MLSVHQHWNPLKVCAVGRCYPPEFFSHIKHPKVRNTFEKIAQETEEDYQKLIKTLEKFNVKVLRTDISEDLDVYRKKKPPAPPMMPRDYLATFGDKVYMPSESYGDNINVEQLAHEIVRDDFNTVIQKIKDNPEVYKYLTDLLLPGRAVSNIQTILKLRKLVDAYRGNMLGTLVSADDAKAIKEIMLQSKMLTIGSNDCPPSFKGHYAFGTIRNWVEEQRTEIVYDEYINSATMARLGKDLYIGIGNLGNKLNEETYMNKWRSKFPEHRLHRIDIPGHIDSVFTPVIPGLILMQEGLQVEGLPDWDIVKLPVPRDTAPEFFANKKKIRGRYWISGEEYNDDFNDYLDEWMGHWVTYVQETAFDLNIVMVDEKNVLCNNENEAVFKIFERYGITPHVVNFRHRFFWDGGLHCMTSDIDRDGEQQDYFPD